MLLQECILGEYLFKQSVWYLWAALEPMRREKNFREIGHINPLYYKHIVFVKLKCSYYSYNEWIPFLLTSFVPTFDNFCTCSVGDDEIFYPLQ